MYTNSLWSGVVRNVFTDHREVLLREVKDKKTTAQNKERWNGIDKEISVGALLRYMNPDVQDKYDAVKSYR